MRRLACPHCQHRHGCASLAVNDAAQPRPNPHRRRRHRRLLDGLPPDEARAQRRAAVGAGAPDLRHHLACGGAGGADAAQPQHDAHEQVRHRVVRHARSRDRPGHRLETMRQRQRGAHARTLAGAEETGRAGAQFRRRGAVDHATRSGRSVPHHAHRRPAGRDLDPRRRQGQPDRPVHLAGQRRASAVRSCSKASKSPA